MNVVFEPPEDGFTYNRNICRGRLIHDKGEIEVPFVGFLTVNTEQVLPKLPAKKKKLSCPDIGICTLLGYYAASCGNCFPTFRDNVSVPSSQVKSPSRKDRKPAT
jgi:hypothetical protein